MSKASGLNRLKFKMKLVNKFKDLHQELKAKVKDPTLSPRDKLEVVHKLAKVGRKAGKHRIKRRCVYTGAARSVFVIDKSFNNEKLGVHRFTLLQMVRNGLLPGFYFK